MAEYVYLGNNPNSRMESGWPAASGHTYDIADFDYGESWWSLACNFPRPKGPRQVAQIAAGTGGTVCRANGAGAIWRR